MSVYSTSHITPAGVDLPMINVTGGLTVQIKMFDVIVGFSSAPSDAQGLLELGRTTDVGSGGTTLSENKVNPLTPASATAAAVGGTFSGAPTYTANSRLLYIPIAKRATFRWVTDPDRNPICSTITANNGLEVICRSVSDSSTPNVVTTLWWKE